MNAKDLLYKILDYNYLWSSPEQRNAKPSIVRLSQIEALQEAFGLTKKYINPYIQTKYWFSGEKQKLNRAQQLNKLTNLEYLLHGEFLHDREKDADKELSDRIITKIIDLYPHLKDYILQKSADIQWLFNNLFNFRQDVYKVTYPNGGMLKGFSTGLYYSFYLQGQLKQIIKDNLSEIDDTLWLILDPAKREFSKEEINYPEADLDEIDHEWRMDNY